MYVSDKGIDKVYKLVIGGCYKKKLILILFYYILSDKGNLSVWEWLWGL